MVKQSPSTTDKTIFSKKKKTHTDISKWGLAATLHEIDFCSRELKQQHKRQHNWHPKPQYQIDKRT